MRKCSPKSPVSVSAKATMSLSSDRERAPHRIALASRRAELWQELVLLHDRARRPLRRSRALPSRRAGIDDEHLVEQAARPAGAPPARRSAPIVGRDLASREHQRDRGSSSARAVARAGTPRPRSCAVRASPIARGRAPARAARARRCAQRSARARCGCGESECRCAVNSCSSASSSSAARTGNPPQLTYVSTVTPSDAPLN